MPALQVQDRLLRGRDGRLQDAAVGRFRPAAVGIISPRPWRMPPLPPEHDDRDDVTIADEEWPVAEQYRVQPRSRPVGRRQHGGDSAGSRPASRPPLPARSRAGALARGARDPAHRRARSDGDLARRAGRRRVGCDAHDRHSRHDHVVDHDDDSDDDVPRREHRSRGHRSDARRGTSAARASDVQVRVRRVSSRGPAGEVLEQSPEPGARLSADTVVILAVSKTPVPERVTVPRVEGLLTSEAASLLRQAGLGVEIETVRSSQPEGTVVSQRPEPDGEVAPRTIVVARGGRAARAGHGRSARARRPRGRLRREASFRSSACASRNDPSSPRSRKGRSCASHQVPERSSERGRRCCSRSRQARPACRFRTSSDWTRTRPAESSRRPGSTVEVVDEPTEAVEEDGIVVGQEPTGGSSRPKGSIVVDHRFPLRLGGDFRGPTAFPRLFSASRLGRTRFGCRVTRSELRFSALAFFVGFASRPL